MSSETVPKTNFHRKQKKSFAMSRFSTCQPARSAAHIRLPNSSY